MSKNIVVSPDQMLDWFEKYTNQQRELNLQFLRGLREKGKGLTLENLQGFLEHKNPFPKQASASVSSGVWESKIRSTVCRKLERFPSDWADRVSKTPLPKEWSLEFLANAARYKMMPGFLPGGVRIDEDFSMEGYVKPGIELYQRIAAGQINKKSGADPLLVSAVDCWVLFDNSRGVNYTDGSQVFQNDPWTRIIVDCRGKGLIGRDHNTPPGSRFSISWREWDQVLLAEMALKLEVSRAQIDLLNAGPFNFVGNIFACHYGEYNMWCWLKDQFEDSHHLLGGYRADGGLASVNYDWHDDRGGGVVGRPLVKFVREG